MPKTIGQPILRKEDRRLVQGQGIFFDDVRRHGMGYVHFVRSPHAHAKIVSIDVSAALEVDGGISRETIAKVWRAGADTFVAGNAIFSATSPKAEIEVLRRLCLEQA